jgi:hypothetical protein
MLHCVNIDEHLRWGESPLTFAVCAAAPVPQVLPLLQAFIIVESALPKL